MVVKTGFSVEKATNSNAFINEPEKRTENLPLISYVPVRIRCTFYGQTGRIFGVVRSSLSNVWRKTIERKVKTTLFSGVFVNATTSVIFFGRRFGDFRGCQMAVKSFRGIWMDARGKRAHAFSYNG